VLIELGPVDAGAAEVWTSHMLGNLEILRGRVELLPFKLPKEIIEDFHDLLAEWCELAKQTDVLEWSADFDEEWLKLIVRYWANLDSLSDEQVARLGMSWAPAEGRPFFEALARAVATTLGDDTFASLLVENARRRPRPDA
jgi:hypothetical protein